MPDPACLPLLLLSSQWQLVAERTPHRGTGLKLLKSPAGHGPTLSNGPLKMASNSPNQPSAASKQETRVIFLYTRQAKTRRLQFVNGRFAAQKPQTEVVVRRNERERRRVNQINSQFGHLRAVLPGFFVGNKKRLSKLQILQFAARYIHYLGQIVKEDEASRGMAEEFDNPGHHQLAWTGREEDLAHPTIQQGPAGYHHGNASVVLPREASIQQQQCLHHQLDLSQQTYSSGFCAVRGPDENEASLRAQGHHVSGSSSLREHQELEQDANSQNLTWDFYTAQHPSSLPSNPPNFSALNEETFHKDQWTISRGFH